MSKLQFVKNDNNGVAVRKSFEFYYTNKFFNKWMKKFVIKGMDYQEAYYMMKKFWFEGTIACSKRIGIPSEVEGMVSSFVLTPWVMSDKYNCYDFPTHARCINVRGVSYINMDALEVDKDIVLLWCQANHKGVYSLIAQIGRAHV